MSDTPADDHGPGFASRRAHAEFEEGARLRRGVVTLLVLVVIVGALVLAVPGLQSVGNRLRDVSPGWLALALALEVGSCAGYVVAFRLVFWRAPRRLTIRIALSEMAFGAVLPVGGAGGIALGAWVARAKGGSVRRFVERSAVLFLLTTGVNAFTLGLAGLLVATGALHAPDPLLLGLLPGLVGTAGIAFFWFLPENAERVSRLAGSGSRLERWAHTTSEVVEDTRKEVLRFDPRLLGAFAYLWCDIAVLWVSFRAFGVTMPVGAITLAFLIGYLGNVLPIPGGIGGLDGGLIGALVAYGAQPANAAAAVLMYHAIVLWLPTLLGLIAFLRLRATLDEPLVLKPETERV